VLCPPPAVLIAVEPPGREVRVQGVDGLQRRVETPLDLLDATHVIPVGWLVVSEARTIPPPDLEVGGENIEATTSAT
jgi:hypothetical protein